MAISVFAHAAATGTTGAIDTTGATLLIAVNNAGGTAAPTDSAGNTWTAIDAVAGGSFGGTAALYYVNNPSTSGTHTFTSTGGFSAVAVLAVSGTDTSSPLDTSVKAVAASPGSITPAGAGELFVVAAQYGNNTAGFTISDPNYAGWLVQDNISGNGGVTYGALIGWVVAGASAAATPTWSGGGTPGDIMAAFKAGAGGGGGGATAVSTGGLTTLGIGM